VLATVGRAASKRLPTVTEFLRRTLAKVAQTLAHQQHRDQKSLANVEHVSEQPANQNHKECLKGQLSDKHKSHDALDLPSSPLANSGKLIGSLPLWKYWSETRSFRFLRAKRPLRVPDTQHA